MYRLDDCVTEIVPGKMDKSNLDFSEPPKMRKYKFEKLRPSGEKLVAETDKFLTELEAGMPGNSAPPLKK